MRRVVALFALLLSSLHLFAEDGVRYFLHDGTTRYIESSNVDSITCSKRISNIDYIEIWNTGSRELIPLADIDSIWLVKPTLRFSAAGLDFGEVKVGESAYRSVHIQNSGSWTETFAIETTGPYTTSSINSYTIFPGKMINLDIVYHPTEESLKGDQGWLTLYSNAVDQGEYRIPLSGYGMNQTAEPVKPDTLSGDIKILFLGNSFSWDALSVVRKLMAELMPNVKYKIGLFYHSGTVLSQLDGWLNYGSAFPKNETETLFQYYVLTNTTEPYAHCNGMTPLACVDKDTWDWIFFQQGSQKQNDSSAYYDYVVSCKTKVQNHIDYTPKYGFLQVRNLPKYGEDGDVAFRTQSTQTKRLVDAGVVDSQIPAGTALQNLLSVSRFVDCGEKGYLSVDGTHLQMGIGELAESLTIVQWIGNILRASVDVTKSTLIPTTASFYTFVNAPKVEIAPIGIDEVNCKLARRAAAEAINNPYSITDLNQ